MKRIVIKKPLYMYPFKNKHTELYDKLNAILNKGEFGSEKEGKDAIKDFFNIFVSKEYKTDYSNPRTHLYYIKHLIPVKIALEQKRYNWACHELKDMLAFHNIFQDRIRINLISLLREYLGGNGNV